MVMVYFSLNKDGYLNEISTRTTLKENEIKMEVPEDHEVLTNYEVFKYENGELVKDVEYQNQLITEAEKEANQPSEDEMNAIAIMELSKMILGGK